MRRAQYLAHSTRMPARVKSDRFLSPRTIETASVSCLAFLEQVTYHSATNSPVGPPTPGRALWSKVRIDSPTLERAIAGVQKPARYVGGEWNAITKDWDEHRRLDCAGLSRRVRDRHVEPRAWRSSTTWSIASHPWQPSASMLPGVTWSRSCALPGIPLYSLESRRQLAEFDVIGFTLQTELTYTNVLNMLDLAGIPLWADAQVDDAPLIIAGGSCCYNPSRWRALSTSLHWARAKR